MQQTCSQISNLPRRFSVQHDASPHFSHPMISMPQTTVPRYQCIQKPPLRNVFSAPIAPPNCNQPMQRKDSLKSNDTVTPSSVSEFARYKTELCRSFEETGQCRYGSKCQFAHGMQELRTLNRHPKYKTELCRTFHTTGLCSYGQRCNFIHNDEERRSPSSTNSPSPTLPAQRSYPPPSLLPFDFPLTVSSTGDSPASSVDGGSPSLSPGYLHDDVFAPTTRRSPTPSFCSEGSLGGSGTIPSPPGSPKYDQRDTLVNGSILDLGINLSLFKM